MAGPGSVADQGSPLYPRKRISAASGAMSAKCQKRTRHTLRSVSCSRLLRARATTLRPPEGQELRLCVPGRDS
jgi:hypothetical protein